MEGVTGSGEVASAATAHPIPGVPPGLLAAADDLGVQPLHVRLRMRGELEHLLVQFLLEDVLLRVVEEGPGEYGGGQRPRLTGRGIDQEELLLHSDSAHVMPPLCGPVSPTDCPGQPVGHLAGSQGVRHQPHSRQRGQRDPDAPVLRLHRVRVAHAAAAVLLGVGVEHLLPGDGLVADGESVLVPDDGEKLDTASSGVPSVPYRRNAKTLSSAASTETHRKPAGSVSRCHRAGVRV